MNLNTTILVFIVLVGDSIFSKLIEEENKSIDLPRMIDSFLYKNQEKKNDVYRSEPFYFHPSEFNRLGCLRKKQYRFLMENFKDNILAESKTKKFKEMFKDAVSGAKLSRIFANGEDVHERYQKYFEDMGILVESERTLKNDAYRIKGKADAIIELNNKEYIVELKSINGISASKLKKPKPDHVKQINLYMFMTGIKEGFILYENKNNQEILNFKIDYKYSKIEPMLIAMESILNNIRNNKLMPKKVDNCAACPFYRLCKYDIKVSETQKTKIDWNDFSEVKE